MSILSALSAGPVFMFVLGAVVGAAGAFVLIALCDAWEYRD